MKLAQALISRAEKQRKLKELQERITRNATVDEGDEPDEKLDDILDEFSRVAITLGALVAQINSTNTSTVVPTGVRKGKTIMELLSERDSLAMIKNQYQNLATGKKPDNIYRGRTKDDIKECLTYSPKVMSQRADDVNKQYRELDTEIQSLNWTFDLVE